MFLQEASRMTTLREALETTPRRLLLAIGRRRGLHLSSNARKAELVDGLAQALPEPGNLSAALADLAGPELRALSDLLAAGGRLPLRYLRPRYGDLRPYRPRRPSETDDAVESPLERLRALGLAFHDRAGNDLFVPADLIPHLPEPELPPPPTSETAPGPAVADLNCHDLAHLLALLQGDDTRPLAGRWLPPRSLVAWGRRCAVPPASPNARSEMQTGRRRFLHYLAENAGLIALCGPFLKPTPAAWLWLGAARSERLQALWDSWSRPDPDRWRAFRLPGGDWLKKPSALVAAVSENLSDVDPSDPAAFARVLLARHPRLYDLAPVNALNAAELLAGAVEQLIRGPLIWLGVLQPGPTGERMHLTPCGQPFPDGDAPPPARFSPAADLRPDPLDSTLSFTLGGGLPDPPAVVCLETCAEADGEREGESRYPYRYRITAASFIRALHRGWSPPALLDALNRLAERPLTGRETALLCGWAELADRTVIHRLAVLETTDPGVIRRLSSARRGRSLIVRSLSPRAVVVDESHLDQLVRRLARQEGLPPRADMPIASGDRDSELSLSPSGAAHAWLALRVYQGLGRLVRLPAHTPQALLEQLAALADPADLTAAEVAAETALAALQEAMDGWSAFPAWPEEGVPVEESTSLIEEALAEGQALQISYYTAGRDELTHRVVEPYRVEWRGPVPYLVGFCHRAQDERVFRLDRIRSIAKAPPVDESREQGGWHDL
jgi:hypothetical protein